jgi:hypothetical protein
VQRRDQDVLPQRNGISRIRVGSRSPYARPAVDLDEVVRHLLEEHDRHVALAGSRRARRARRRILRGEDLVARMRRLRRR